MESTINKKNIALWTLYDFSKAVVIVVFALYFSQWLVVDKGVNDLWYNMIFVGASILLFATAPVLAIVADKKNSSILYLRIAATALFFVTILTGLFAVFSYSNFHFVLFAALSYVLSNYFYQFSLVFYNAFLFQLAPMEKQGFVSGIGYTFNWIGQIFGVLIALPFATGVIYLFGEHGRAQTFIPVTILFFILALPMLLFFKEQGEPIKIKINYVEEYKHFLGAFLKLCQAPGVGRFLLGFFLFNDAILTLENNYAIYLQQVFGVSDQVKSLLLLGLLVTAALGSFISGWIGDKVGLKKSLLFILVSTIILFPFLALTKSFIIFSILTIITGLVYGASWTVSRAILSYLAPKGEINHTFSYYSLVERFATFVGPVAWGLTIAAFAEKGIFKYRISMLVLDVFIILGAIIISKIPSDKNQPV